MGLKFNANKGTIKDYVSEEILTKFVKQLPWSKDQLLKNEYKDVVKIDQFKNTSIKLKDGKINAMVFLKLLLEFPKFELGQHKYEFRLSSLYRTGLTPKKHVDKFPMFHVRKIIDKVAV